MYVLILLLSNEILTPTEILNTNSSSKTTWASESSQNLNEEKSKTMGCTLSGR